jgi:hypothetical protein
MSEIEIGLRAIIQDIDFAMLERVHRPGIDVEVWVKLLENHSQSTRFQQRTERSGRETFA